MSPVSTPTKRDAIDAALSVAEDVQAGRLDSSTLAAEFSSAARSLFGRVIGPGDDLWQLQVDVARGVLAAGGVSTAELAEWLAVQRRRDGDAEADTDTEAEAEVTPDASGLRVVDADDDES